MCPVLNFRVSLIILCQFRDETGLLFNSCFLKEIKFVYYRFFSSLCFIMTKENLSDCNQIRFLGIATSRS